MMYFRRLYWVTEKLSKDGKSEVVGVYTSIPDLIDEGLVWFENHKHHHLRISLVKLDSSKAPLGCWHSPLFKGMHEDLGEYVITHDFTDEECRELVGKLKEFATTLANF
jgi:hypothetical protein